MYGITSNMRDNKENTIPTNLRFGSRIIPLGQINLTDILLNQIDVLVYIFIYIFFTTPNNNNIVYI